MRKKQRIERTNRLMDEIEKSGFISDPDSLMRNLNELGVDLIRVERAIGQRLTNYKGQELSIIDNEDWKAIRREVGANIDLTNKFTAAKTGHTHNVKAGGLVVVHPSDSDQPVVALGQLADRWNLPYTPSATLLLVENQALMTHFQATRKFITNQNDLVLPSDYDLGLSSGMQALSDEYRGFYAAYTRVVGLFDFDVGGIRQIVTLSRRCTAWGLSFHFFFPSNISQILAEGYGRMLTGEEKKAANQMIKGVWRDLDLDTELVDRIISYLKLMLRHGRTLEQEFFLLPYIEDAK